ncbi:MAG TPA: hypothetical protein VMG59_02510 [Phycisphaerae bacterium]|nr:hypothetical protein [Phycisphaerae bacterium]
MNWGIKYTFLVLAILALYATGVVYAHDTTTGVRQSPLPDPFTLTDGKKVKTAADWQLRRSELLTEFLNVEYGHAPAPPGNVTGTVLVSGENLNNGGLGQLVKLTMGPQNALSFNVQVFVPPGDGPFPVIIYNGSLDQTTVPIDNIMSRGYMLVVYDPTWLIDDANHTDDLFKVYPNYDWGTLAAVAWELGRVVDYVQTRTDADASNIYLTGFSRNGKAALLAGALDQRIALVNPVCSGAGGAGCYRYDPGDEQTLNNVSHRFAYWFVKGFSNYSGREDQLPFDQFELEALVAPRALLITQATEDRWSNPEGEQISWQAAKQVYEFLGVGNQIGIYFHPGIHELTVDDWNALMDFADQQLLGGTVNRSFDKPAYPDAPQLFTWQKP